MGKKSLIPLFILVIGMCALSVLVGTLLASREWMGAVFIVALSAIPIPLLAGVAVELRDTVPPGYVEIGTMPPDGVERRWIKIIHDAIQPLMYPPQIWDGASPLQKAEHDAQIGLNQSRVHLLLDAARRSSGTRLPPEVTVREQ